MKDDRLHLDRILDSIRKIELYSEERTKEQFFADGKTQSAVLLQLLLIGETAKRVSEEIKSSLKLYGILSKRIFLK